MGITIKSLAEIEEEVSRGCNARLTLTPLAQNAKQTGLGVVIKCLRQQGPVGSTKPQLNKSMAQLAAILS